MTVQDWLNKWNDSLSDVQNTLDLLQEYAGYRYASHAASTLGHVTTPIPPIQDHSALQAMTSWITRRIWLHSATAVPMTTVNVSNARIADVTNALLLIEQLNATSSQAACYIPIEYVLACVKQAIHHYQGYRFVFDRYVNSNMHRHIATRALEPNEFLITHSVYPNVHYVVISPNNEMMSGIFSCEWLQPKWRYFKNEIDMVPYADQILAITSQFGHTRGPHIHETDELTSLLEAIRIKTGVDYFKLDYIDILDNYKNLNMLVSIGESSQWKKQGDFTQQITHDLLDRSVHYFNTMSSKTIISAIHLSRYKNGRLALKVTASNPITFAELEKEIIARELPSPSGCSIVVDCFDHAEGKGRKNCYELHVNSHIRCGRGERDWSYFQYRDATGVKQSVKITNAEAFKTSFPWFALVNGSSDMKLHLTNDQMGKLISVIDHVPPAFSNPGTNEYVVYVADSSADNLDRLIRLLDVVVDVDPSTADVFKELCDSLNIHYVQQSQDDIQTTLASAIHEQTKAHYRPIWDLALAFKADFFSDNPQKSITLDQLMHLYQSISVENTHYAEANFELSHLIVLIERDKDNNYALQQQQFRYAFRSGNQEFIDNLYQSLSGRGYMPSEQIEGIKGDEEILIALANQLNEANQKINSLSSAQWDSHSKKESTPIDHAGNSCRLFNSTERSVRKTAEQPLRIRSNSI